MDDARQDRLIALMRAYGASYTELTRRFAESLCVHSTDANALIEIIYAEDAGMPLTPAKLSAVLALSRPAVSAMLNRLESAEYIVRSREHQDRRTVTLRIGHGIQPRVIAFFTPLSNSVAGMLERYTDGALDDVERFVGEFSETILRELSASASPPDTPM